MIDFNDLSLGFSSYNLSLILLINSESVDRFSVISSIIYSSVRLGLFIAFSTIFLKFSLSEFKIRK